MFLVPLCLLATLVAAKCYDPSPAFPVPSWADGQASLEPAFEVIERSLKTLLEDERYNTSSFSIDLTSGTGPFWSSYHTARKHNASRPGVTRVDGDSIYRIASITKTFTVLGILQQHAAGNLSLDDPVSKHIPELSGPHSGEIPWKDITLRVLASQLSGIPREMDQADLINVPSDLTKIGLPPVSRQGLPSCYEYDFGRSCNRTDLLDSLKKAKPVFAPNQKSTYSNVAFEVLGLVLENVAGVNYSTYLQQAVFAPLDMSLSSVAKPSDEHAVLPYGNHFWDVEMGTHAPTGGVYSSSSDMSKYMRYVLTHYNALATGVNWMLPASWSTGMNSFYGMPFEIFRTDALLENTKRPVTFVTKGGAVPGYYSDIIFMPEYGLGVTILTAGDDGLVQEIREIVTVELVQAAEKLVWKHIDRGYTGTYIARNTSLNSSLEVMSSSAAGLVVESFVSNGTDVFEALRAFLGPDAGIEWGKPWRAQLVPTLLYKNETSQQGEIWRLLFVPGRQFESGTVWDEFCTTDVDGLLYACLPLNEVVFWHDEGVVELPAWRVAMRKTGGKEKLVVQA